MTSFSFEKPRAFSPRSSSSKNSQDLSDTLLFKAPVLGPPIVGNGMKGHKNDTRGSRRSSGNPDSSSTDPLLPGHEQQGVSGGFHLHPSKRVSYSSTDALEKVEGQGHVGMVRKARDSLYDSYQDYKKVGKSRPKSDHHHRHSARV